MAVTRYSLTPDYSISRIIKGGWHLAGGHGSIQQEQAIEDMRAFVEAGITTFDCADIYTGVEALIGQFLNTYRDQIREGALPTVQIHTKYVPDQNALADLSKQDTESIIDRSLRRLGVAQLDLVQFHWWDYEVPGYIETAWHLQEMVAAGKIRHLGITNFDGKRIQQFCDAGINLTTNQVQYSLLDQRPHSDQETLSTTHNLPFLCYGTLAGGFLSERFLGKKDTDWDTTNRSLIKYRLIIEEFGGYDRYQALLQMLFEIAEKYHATLSQVAMKYMLETPQVAALIVGARNNHHLPTCSALCTLRIDPSDYKRIEHFIEGNPGPLGPVYDLERDKSSRHGRIMKYNLNDQRT